MKTPPVEKIDLMEYRTIDSTSNINPSRNLIDIIQQMERVQDWLIDYRRDEEWQPLSFVGSVKTTVKVHTVVNRLYKDLQLPFNWHESCKDTTTAFNYIRTLLENLGIIVMQNGIVGQNTHRKLDVKEFRAFALVDKLVPLIFINAGDTQNGKLFSLFHEATHIWLGKRSLYNRPATYTGRVSKLEVLCNAVAGELILPQQLFLQEWEKSDANTEIKFKDIAQKFHCSSVVVARKALDNDKISQADYKLIVAKMEKAYEESLAKSSSGGDYYNTQKSRPDGYFIRALCQSVSEGKTSYTEAFRLTNTSYKTFPEIAKAMGGEL